jgi:response regulator NasT
MAERPERGEQIGETLRAAGHVVAAAVGDLDEVAERVRRTQADAVVADLVQPSRRDIQRLAAFYRDQPMPVAVFADDSDTTMVHAAVKAGIGSYVVGGYQPARVLVVLEAAIARFRELQALRRQRDGALAQLAERRNIERAKGVLMRRRDLPENEAYKVLRKMAAERGRRLIEVAETILSAEERLRQG